MLYEDDERTRSVRLVLPSWLRPETPSDLVRLGKDNDGGYLVSKADMRKAECLISLGIKDDWSFEVNFQNENKCPVIAFDASTDSKKILKRGVRKAIKIYTLYGAFADFKKYINYHSFFSTSGKHVPFFIGPFHEDDAYKPFSHISAQTESKAIFLKIDIEGDEYRLLNDIVKIQTRLVGLVIEFHDCDLHQDKIKEFLEKIDLSLLHVHINNWSPICSGARLPKYIEITLGRGSASPDLYKNARAIDMPNTKHRPDFVCCFSNR